MQPSLFCDGRLGVAFVQMSPDNGPVSGCLRGEKSRQVLIQKHGSIGIIEGYRTLGFPPAIKLSTTA